MTITEGEKRKKTQDKSPVKEKVKKPKEEKKAEGKPKDALGKTDKSQSQLV